MKYAAAIGIMLLVNNEIFSLAMLSALAVLFWVDVAKERFNG